MFSFFKRLFGREYEERPESAEVLSSEDSCSEKVSDDAGLQRNDNAEHTVSNHRKTAYSRPAGHSSKAPVRRGSQMLGTRPGTTVGHGTASKPSIRNIPAKPPVFMGADSEKTEE